jgi:hypothetical protein
MSDPSPTSADPGRDVSTGELISRVSQQSSQLVRDEIRLAQVETAAKVKHGIMGAAEFGVAGVLALYGLFFVFATIALGLAEAMPGWLASLIVTVLIFAIAGVVALLGKKQVGEVAPVVPEQAVEGLKAGVETLRGRSEGTKP